MFSSKTVLFVIDSFFQIPNIIDSFKILDNADSYQF
jgi:hypothetical protein